MKNKFNIDLEKLVSNSIPAEFKKSSKVNEAYVAQQKTYKQVSELVSQKTKDAHVELYKRYVDTLNNVSAELDTADKSEGSSNHSMYRSCRLDETFNLNAVWLHELYFANCFDVHSELVMDSMAYMKLQKDFGTFDDWQRDFISCAMSAGNGWAICGYNIFLKKYVNTFISHHSADVQLGFYPLIVLDMWEHAYARDYAADKKSYIVSQMREFNWTVIEERFSKAEALAQVFKQ